MSRPDTLRRNRWLIAPKAPPELFQQTPGIHPVLLQVLYNRGITQPRQIDAFLQGYYVKDTDPSLLSDMDRAVKRIEQAIQNEETIVVYGDFDADGVTATVLLVEALRKLGAERNLVRPYIPDRIDEGYGLNTEALTSIREAGASLVITVDCGIRSLEEASHARALGLDIIITDHHSLGRELPDATAVINPKRPDSSYPEKHLAGVGIAYKLAQALQSALPGRSGFYVSDLLDLVALGTVADLAPLLGENRTMVIQGLQVINSYRRAGIKALAQVAGLTQNRINSESIAFGLGPRINAAGRLSHAYDAARLLAANNDLMAKKYARELDQLNRERQRLTEQLTKKADDLIQPDAPLLFAADPDFVPGIVGLAASRLSDYYYKPAIIVEQGPEESRGSCRSIPEFHITDALDEVSDLLVRHGGHAQAAGFTIRNQNLDAFQERMTGIAAEQLVEKELLPAIPVDAEIMLGDIDWALLGVLEKLEPTGYANATPIFVSRNVHVYSHRPVGQSQNHLQLAVHDGSMRMKIPAIAFKQGVWSGNLPEIVDLAYTIGVNDWNGRRDIQLNVRDIKQAHADDRT